MTNATTIKLPEIPDRLLTVKQAAQILNLCVRSIQYRIKNRELSSIVLGKRSRRIRYTAIEDYIQRMEAGTQRQLEESHRQLSFLSSSDPGKRRG